MAFEFDPRIKKQRQEEEEARQAAKQAKKDAKASYWKEVEEKKQVEEEKKQAEIDSEIEAAKQLKEAKKAANKLFRDTQKDIITYCADKIPNSKYDRFFLEESLKMFSNQETLDILFGKLKNLNDSKFEEGLLNLVGHK